MWIEGLCAGGVGDDGADQVLAARLRGEGEHRARRRVPDRVRDYGLQLVGAAGHVGDK